MEKRIPDLKTQFKAALNIEIALEHMPKKRKPLSESEQKFRQALGVRLKVDKGDQNGSTR